jgi:hypothetical protein
MPEEWRALPVYRWETNAPFQLVERVRGPGERGVAPIAIQRSLWLDDDGKALTFQDRLSGPLREIRRFDAIGRTRIAQLVGKSNQFNLTTRRYSEQEIEKLERDSDTVTMQMRLADIFGDAGMISVIVGRKHRDAIDIETWLMSCRVLGRRVEEAALKVLADRARELGLSRITGDYLPTPRNGIVAGHYSNLGFRRVSDLPQGGSRWELLLDSYSEPDLPIKIEIAG